jgi:tetratricopeptide (TPR) repeat protein
VELGNLYRNDDRFPEAAEAYSRSIAAMSDPDKADWRIFYFRGVSYERSKRWPAAEADFKQALKINPEQPQVLNYLGYSWVDKGIHLDEALEMIKAAVDSRPNDGYNVDSLGWAYYKLGRYEEAVSELERAIGFQPEDPTINDHLGDAYWKVGRKREATFQWAHARDLEPDKELLPVILSKLQHGLQDSPAPLTMSPAPAASPATAPTAGAQNAPATPGAQTSVPPVAAQPTSMAARAAGGAIVPGAMLSLPAAAASN